MDDAELLNALFFRLFATPNQELSCISRVTWSELNIDTKSEIIASQRLFRTNHTSYLLHGIKTFSTSLRLLVNDSVEIPLTDLTASTDVSHNDDSMSDAPQAALHGWLLSQRAFNSSLLFTSASNPIGGAIKLVCLRTNLEEVKTWAATALV